MALRFPMNEWQSLADDYDLPVTLVGYIARQLLTKKHKTLKVVVKCLEKYYHMRKAAALKKKQEKEQKLHFMAIMHWKLGLGNFNKQISGESPLPNKSKTATLNDWKTESMPNNSEDVSEVTMNFMIPSEPMKIIQRVIFLNLKKIIGSCTVMRNISVTSAVGLECVLSKHTILKKEKIIL